MNKNQSDFIDREEYLNIFSKAKNIRASNADEIHQNYAFEKVLTILDKRTSNGISVEDLAFLLVNGNRYPAVYNHIKKYSSKLRSRLYSNFVSVMAPLEYGSNCMSNCIFCGWRSTNDEMPRLKLSEEGVKAEAEHLARLGFSHIELSGGDNLPFLKVSLPKYLRMLKESAAKILPEVRSSICLTPLNQDQYQKLRNECNLDVVLTWQETYEQNTFEKYVIGGPKRYGIDSEYNLQKMGNGFLARLQSQEYALRAGLQVGIGSMVGLNPSTEADILSCMMHGRLLIDHFDGQIQPLIFGLPIWRPITTPKTDLRESRITQLKIDDLFILTSALYLLGMPDHYAWVFPNCRVPLDVQIEAIHVAGCFSSTEVSVAPGGYRVKGSNENQEYSIVTRKGDDKNYDLIRQGEQFSHFYSSHAKYIERFKIENFKVVTDHDLLKIGGHNVASLC